MVLARASLLWSALAHAGLLVAFACLVGTRQVIQRARPLVRFDAFASDATDAARAVAPISWEVLREDAPVDAAVDWPPPIQPDPVARATDPEPCERREHCRVPAASMQRRVVATPLVAEVQPTTEAPPPAAAPATAAPSAPSVRTIVPIVGTNQPPEYPALARRRRWEGTVVLGIDCDADGLVQLVTVVRSSGHQVLDEAAIAAVRQWHFAAGPGHCEQPITFTLQTQ